MSRIDLERDGEVFVLRMKVGENRFNADFLADLDNALAEVEASEGPAALVTTGEGKFYSNGLDLDWLMDKGEAGRSFVGSMLITFARILACPLPTAAAINGHAFAAGGMMALAHDYRVMREDRGYFCLPEIDLGIPLVEGMTELIRSKFSGALLRDTVLAGVRIGGTEAVERGAVDAAVAEDEVVARAVELVAPHAAKDRATRVALKRSVFREALAVMEDPARSMIGGI